MRDELTDWVTRIVDTLGYAGVAVLIALENVFPPLPSELILPLAGFETGRGNLNYPLMVSAATAGSVVGALVLYGLAGVIGEDRIRALIHRYGRWLRISDDDLDRADAWFDRYSTLAVLVCRCVPLVRSLVSIPAGFRRMPPPRFIILTAIGSAIWNAALIGSGWALGDNWHRVEAWVGYVQYIVILGGLALLAWFVWTRFPRRRAAPVAKR